MNYDTIIAALDSWDNAVQNGIATDPDAALVAGNELARLVSWFNENEWQTVQ